MALPSTEMESAPDGNVVRQVAEDGIVLEKVSEGLGIG